MLLTRIEASGFRNLEGFAELGPGLNIFYGDNAQGKTNWLEAIYILGNTKSFRTSQLRECIAFDHPQALLRGETLRGSVTKQIQLLIAEDSKQLFVNGKREALARYLGNLAVFRHNPELFKDFLELFFVCHREDFLRGYLPVVQFNAAIAEPRDHGVMRDHYDGASLAMQITQ